MNPTRTTLLNEPVPPFRMMNLSQMDFRDPFTGILFSRLQPVSALLALFYLLSAGIYIHLLHADLTSIIPLKALGSSLLFLGLAWACRSRTLSIRWTHPLSLGIAGLVLLNCFLTLTYTEEPKATVHLSLFLVAFGCFFFEKRWFFLSLAAGLFGWLAIAFLSGFNLEWQYFGFVQLCAALVSVLVFHLRTGTMQDFVAAVQQLQAVQESLMDRTARLQEAALQLHDQVSERKEKERELALMYARHQAVLDSATLVSIVATDPQGLITVFNTGAERMLGYRADELIGKNTPELLHRESEVQEHSAVLSAKYGRPIQGFDVIVEEARQGYGEEREWTYLRKDGSEITVSLGVTAVRGVDGCIVGYLGIASDITMRKKAEAALRESEERHRTVFDHVLDGIITIDSRGRIESFNSAAETIFGYRASETVGQNVSMLLPEEQQDKHDRYIAEYLESGETRAIGRGRDLWGRRKDGSLFPLELGITHIRLGNRLVFTGLVRDITERKRYEADLRNAKEEAEIANRAKSDFLARMSHELRTPLNSIIGFSNVLLKNKRAALDSQEMNYLGRIQQNGKHLLALINDILDLSKVEAGRMTVEKTDTCLSRLLQETVGQMEGQVKSKQVALRVEMPDEEIRLNVDGAKLKQVLINLIGNAVKFTERGVVTVRLHAPSGSPEFLDVEDTGIGIAADKVETIFQAFQQAESGITSKYSGTGLGLAISRSLCHLLGYSLTVVSEVGKGSRFRIGFQNADREGNPSAADSSFTPLPIELPSELDSPRSDDVEQARMTGVAGVEAGSGMAGNPGRSCLYG